MTSEFTPEYIEKRDQWEKECWDFIHKADYKSATTHAKLGLKLFPNDTIAKFNYYSILADYASAKNTKELIKSHNEAILGMKKLFGKMSDQGITLYKKFSLQNEYYFQTRQFKKQYYLGKRYYDKHGEKRFLYSSGVGAAHYALGVAKENNQKMASLWAERSIEAWELYFEHNSKYYNPYVHYAIAWGILGNKSKMMKALKNASKLSGQPMTYSEFTLTIKSINEISFLK